MLFTNIKDVITTYYITTPLWLAMTGIALLYLLIRLDKSGVKKMLLIVFFFIVVILNDVSYKYLTKVVDPASYYRFLWVIPNVMLIAYALMRIFLDIKEKDKRKKAGFALGLLGLFFAALYFTQSNYYLRLQAEKPQNMELISGDIWEVKAMIDGDREQEAPAELPVLAVPQMVMLQYQTVDPGCIVSTNRVVYLQIREKGQTKRLKSQKYQDKYLLSTICQDSSQPEIDEAKKAIERQKIDYMIVQTAGGMENYMESLGGSLLGKTAFYEVYKMKN